MATARYPGDPRARPARAFCAVSATGVIRRRRDELIYRVAVCWLNGSSHDTEPHHLSDALRCKLNLHQDEFQVLKHFPERYLVIFSEPAVRQRVVDMGVLPDKGRVFHFASWTERRYATNVSWEFRVKVRIEGVLVHCWGEEVAAKALGKSCAIHYIEEKTLQRDRTRSFDLWAWCCDPCDIPTEVWLTVTESDRELPHRDDPVDLKRGQVYLLRNHLEVVEDLTFLQGRGRISGPPNRKARREFDWSYGAPDTVGERQQGRRSNDRRCDIRHQPRRDDDDYDGRRAEDCISSNRWRGRRDSPPRGSRRSSGVQQAATLFWKVKERKEDKRQKRVTFAAPIATELKPPKINIQDDSIMLIKDRYTVMVEDQKHTVDSGLDSSPKSVLEEGTKRDNSMIKDMAVGLLLDLQGLLEKMQRHQTENHQMLSE